VTLNQETMPAVRLLRWQSEPELVTVPTPEPGAGEVLVKVEAAGLCHTDLHLMEWPAGTMPYTLPFTLGHETAGTVAALGPGARGVSEGDRVLVYARWGCGACWPCLQGMENLCETAAGDLGGHGGGVGRDGGGCAAARCRAGPWSRRGAGCAPDMTSVTGLADRANL
jgi:alcohol dehydrogenase, propanol-preferring